MQYLSWLTLAAIGGIAILPLKKSRFSKILLMIVVASVIFRLRIFALLSGHPLIPPPFPGWLCLTFAGLWFAAILFSLLLIVAGIYRLFRKLCGGPWRSAADRRVDLALLAVSLVITAWGLYNGSQEPVLKSYTVEIPDLPPQAKGFRIAVLTDLHVDSRCSAKDLHRLVERTNALDPDIIALLGDNLDGYFYGKNDVLVQKLEELQHLRAKYGVFGVPGNHEYYSGYRDWIGFLLNHHVQMLENAHVDLPCHLTIAGVTDIRAEDEGEILPDSAAAISDSRYPAILLSHQPIDAEKNAKERYILQLSGHTHGGLFPPLKQYVAKRNNGFVSGWYEVGKMKLYVSNGTGIWGGLPVRFGTQAEITLITLQ